MHSQLINQLPDYPITRLPDSRPISTIGRHARLELAFERRRGRTVLAHAYAEPPFRVGHGFDVDDALYLIIVCAAPGIFAGDDLSQQVHVGRGARVLLASQSALQVRPSPAPHPARISHHYHVADDGELHCWWDPIIPFEDARLVQRLDVRIEEGSRLYWSDALMAGRSRHGEAWKFREIDHELRLSVGSTLRYLERFRARPGDGALQRRWSAGSARYVGTALVHHPNATAVIAERIQRRLDECAGVRAGVDAPEPSLVAARLLAEGGAGFARARFAFRGEALETIFGNPRLVMRR